MCFVSKYRPVMYEHLDPRSQFCIFSDNVVLLLLYITVTGDLWKLCWIYMYVHVIYSVCVCAYMHVYVCVHVSQYIWVYIRTYAIT